MEVKVTSHRHSVLDEQEVHRISEGMESAEGPTHLIPNAINVKQIHHTSDPAPYRDDRWSDEYLYPEIRVTDATGTEHVFNSAIAHLDETDPEVDIWRVHDETASDECAKVTHYTGYGVQSETYTDDFDHERTSHSVYIQTQDDKTILLTPSKTRGLIVKPPEGQTRRVGNPDQHSHDVQINRERTTPKTHPYSTPDGHLTITADGETYSGIENVTRPKPGEYLLHSTHGNRIRVSDITDVQGALYTVTARHKSKFNHGVTTTSIKRALGVYIDEKSDFKASSDPALRAIGHPNSAAVHKTPSTYRIAYLSDIESFFVKTPTGEIHRDFDAIPRF